MANSESLRRLVCSLFNLDIVSKSSRAEFYKVSLAMEDRVWHLILHDLDNYYIKERV